VLSNANGLGGPQTWTRLPDTQGRAFHSAEYDPASNRMMIFGGNRAFFGTNLNDVRVLTNANGLGGTPQWIPLSPIGTPPAPREMARTAYDQNTNRLILFGGAQFPSSSSSTVFNDVWILSNANGLGGTPQWIQLSPTGPLPSPRAAHFVGYDPPTRRMIAFGGFLDQRPSSPILFNDVWVLTEADGLGGTPQWIQLSPSGGPPLARFGFTAGLSPASNQMVVSLGRIADVGPGHLIADTWLLSGANGIAALEVEIDIKPGSDPNCFNNDGHGVIPVAILGSADFDVTQVDAGTVKLEGLDVAARGKAEKLLAHVEDVNGDGFDDLVLNIEDTDGTFSSGSGTATLTGNLLTAFGGTPIQGTDAICVVP
jgi:hypothetical protein